MEELKEGPYCDKNNPNDINYPNRERGDYDHNCNWIWDIGVSQDEDTQEVE